MEMESLSRVLEQLQANLTALKLKNQDPSQKKQEELLSLSSYKCQECRDTGWLLKESEKGAPDAAPCQCRENEKQRAQWKAAGIDVEMSTQTFKTFQEWNSSSKKAKDTAMAYLQSFQSNRSKRHNSIMFCGQVGSGKTHLSVAIALNLIKKNIKVVYMPYRDVLTKLKQNILDEEIYKQSIAKYQSCDVLLVDDLFKGKVTESDINIIFEILNHRYQNNLPIIVSTEYTLEKMLYFDEAIGSRIYEMCKGFCVEIEVTRGNNFRLR